MNDLRFLMYACFVLFLFTGCNDSYDSSLDENELSSEITRTFNEGYFDWDRINEISYINHQGVSSKISLPWAEGSGHNIGIPDSWIVPKNSNFYSRENGWVLVYSNIKKSSEINKYFALYNKYTGFIRFFFYRIGEVTGASGSNSTFIGINVNKATSLMNFTGDLATGINDKRPFSGYSFSPKVRAIDNSIQAIGMEVNQWYGMEMECAYDPQLPADISFNTMIWGAKIVRYTGNATTTGKIKGNIISSSPNMPNLSLQFAGNHSNSVKTTYHVDPENVGEVLGTEIEYKINKGDEFYTVLWNNIKNNASSWISNGLLSGAKSGIEAIMSSGGSVIGKSLGGVFNSLIGKNNQNIMKVDLSLNAESIIEMESHEEVTGWRISPFPVPASRTYDAPLYNISLGVWNLERTPQVVTNLFRYRSNSVARTYHNLDVNLRRSNVILNPAIAEECVVKNLKEYLLLPRNTFGFESNQYSGEEELINMEPYYNVGLSWSYSNKGLGALVGVPGVKVRISFDLYNRKTNEMIGHFSKCFKTETILGTVNEVWEPRPPIGGGGLER